MGFHMAGSSNKGNLTDNGAGMTMSWDYENRMTSASIAGSGGSSAPTGDLLIHWSLDENQGTTANDTGEASAPDVDGDLSGPTWQTAGRLGSSLDFDGSNDIVTNLTTADDALNGLSAVTVSVWVKADVTATDKGVFLTEAPDGGDKPLGIRYDKSGTGGGGNEVIKASIRTTSGYTQIESSSYVQTTDWQHLTLVWTSGASLKLYINGVENVLTHDDGALGGTVTNVDRLLVGQGAKTGNYWDGQIDELRIYGRALSAAEIASLADPEGSGSGTTAQYRYDALGRRVQKQVGSDTTTFAMAGAQVLAEYENGATAANPERRFVYASYVDEPVAMFTDTDSNGTDEVYYYHANHLYSVAAITDDVGNVVERYGYDAYGARVILNGAGTAELAESAIGQPYGFTGRRFDDETGLWFFRSRSFDSELGRFISRDPYGDISRVGFGFDLSNPMMLILSNFLNTRSIQGGYVDGFNLYAGYFALHGGLDPTGMAEGDPPGPPAPPGPPGPGMSDQELREWAQAVLAAIISGGTPPGVTEMVQICSVDLAFALLMAEARSQFHAQLNAGNHDAASRIQSFMRKLNKAKQECDCEEEEDDGGSPSVLILLAILIASWIKRRSANIERRASVCLGALMCIFFFGCAEGEDRSHDGVYVKDDEGGGVTVSLGGLHHGETAVTTSLSQDGTLKGLTIHVYENENLISYSDYEPNGVWDIKMIARDEQIETYIFLNGSYVFAQPIKGATYLIDDVSYEYNTEVQSWRPVERWAIND